MMGEDGDETVSNLIPGEEIGLENIQDEEGEGD